MAKTADIKIPADIEYRVISNCFGLLIAVGGLLAGAMVHERSLEYWPSDIVQLVIAGWLAFRLFRNLLATMQAGQLAAQAAAPHHHQQRQSIPAEKAAAGQIASKKMYTEQEVLDEVVKRIETKKAEASKTNKFTN